MSFVHDSTSIWTCQILHIFFLIISTATAWRKNNKFSKFDASKSMSYTGHLIYHKILNNIQCSNLIIFQNWLMRCQRHKRNEITEVWYYLQGDVEGGSFVAYYCRGEMVMAVATLSQDPKAAHFANILLSNQTLNKSDALDGKWWKKNQSSSQLNLSEFSDMAQVNSKVNRKSSESSLSPTASKSNRWLWGKNWRIYTKSAIIVLVLSLIFVKRQWIYMN